MFDLLLAPQNLVAGATALAVFATILTLLIPVFAKNQLNDRMKVVALERDAIRKRERQRLHEEKEANKRGMSKRKEANPLMVSLVEKLSLKSALADDKTEEMLLHAGMRGQPPLFMFLTARFLLPFLFAALGAAYVFIYNDPADFSGIKKFAYIGGAGYFGFYLPLLIVRSRAKNRQLSITMAWPDALDLALICVESGMSIEAAFRKVASEIGQQSIPLAEELTITVAELSYLSDRQVAYNNLVKRTGLEAVKNVVLSLIQAERYGTPLGSALRVLSQENRDQRMNKAEMKAAQLPPKLTVPMMVCFLPVLFAVILGPAIISVMATFAANPIN